MKSQKPKLVFCLVSTLALLLPPATSFGTVLYMQKTARFLMKHPLIMPSQLPGWAKTTGNSAEISAASARKYMNVPGKSSFKISEETGYYFHGQSLVCHYKNTEGQALTIVIRQDSILSQSVHFLSHCVEVLSQTPVKTVGYLEGWFDTGHFHCTVIEHSDKNGRPLLSLYWYQVGHLATSDVSYCQRLGQAHQAGAMIQPTIRQARISITPSSNRQQDLTKLLIVAKQVFDALIL